MQALVAIPDPVLKLAELEAGRLNVSLGELFALALAAWLENRREIEAGAAPDPVWAELAWRSLALNSDEEDRRW